MKTVFRPLLPAAAFAALLGVSACAPTNTNSTYSSTAIGRPAAIGHGTIISMRPVVVKNPNTGLGATTGAVAGGAIGSTIGGDWRANVLGAVGGALIGGVVGNAVENQVGTGQAVEFIIREDNGQTISVVQTNEDNFQPGERVTLIFGERTRIARSSGY